MKQEEEIAIVARAELDNANREAIVRRYSERLLAFGNDPRTLNVGSDEKYRMQHAVHAGIADLDGRTVLDIGCGLANYYQFLCDRRIRVSYVGYDIVPAFIEINRKRFPDATFELREASRDDIAEEVDYVVMCQVFNNRYAGSDNDQIVKAVLSRAFAAARLGVSIDMLSSYVNYREDKLAYFSPHEMFAFAKSLTRFVCLRHDYAPFHFTLFLYKQAVSA